MYFNDSPKQKYGGQRIKICKEIIFNSKTTKIQIYDTQKEKHQVKAFLLFMLILIYLPHFTIIHCNSYICIIF